MSSSDSCAVKTVLTIRSGVGRSSHVCFLLSYINGCAYRSSCVLREQLEGVDPILIPHGNAVYDGLQRPAKDHGCDLIVVEVGRYPSDTDRRGPKVGIATKGGCARSRGNAILTRTLYRASHQRKCGRELDSVGTKVKISYG